MARSRRTPPPPPPQSPWLPPLVQVAQRLRLLENRDGHIAEADVVDDARDPDSPCHSYFEWDDTEAARQHRLQQARQLIRRVKIEITVTPVSYVLAPKYVKDYKNNTGYRDVYKVRTEEDTARETFIAELLRVRSAMRRAKATAHALELGGDEIEQIDELVTGLFRRVSIDDQPEGTA